MSSEYMRQILESIEIAQQIDEGYEERVQAVADEVLSMYPDGVPKAAFVDAVEKAADKHGAREMRPSVAGRGQKVGDSRKDFLKDVKAKIGRFKTDTSKADAKKARKEEVLWKLQDIITLAVGNAFPDGDPFDHIFPKARALGIRADDVLDWLNLAARKHLHAKDYYSYLRDTWDDYIDTTSDTLGPRDNPWK